MPEYTLAPDAVTDLRKIGRYTTKQWSQRQAERYRARLARCFAAIAAGRAQSTHPIPHRPDLRSTRCEHHYIFSRHREGEPPLIVAVLHENMDLPSRLKARLAGPPS